MIKRLLSCMLCVVMLLGLVSCKKGDEDDADKGAYINMYLSDIVYDLDPLHSSYNDSALKVSGLLFDTLFKLDSKGKVKNELVKKYEIIEDENTQEYKMLITLKDTHWSDGTYVSANDVVYTFKRILDCENSSEAGALLYDIKNARKVKHGDVSIDSLGVYAVDELVVEFTFENRIDENGNIIKVDYDKFIRTLASPMFAPLPESIVAKGEDWAKKPATMVSSGPFKLRSVSYEKGKESMVLERNDYYLRNKDKDALDKYVTPYRIIVDYSMTDEEIAKAYNDGLLFFVGDIPMSLRNQYKDVAKVSDAISTHVYYFQTQTLEVPITYEEELANKAESERVSKELAESILAESNSNKVTTSSSTQKPPEPEETVLKGQDAINAEERHKLIEFIENINKNAELFKNADVRKALSLAIDRDSIAEKVVFAKAANALVPYSIFNEDSAKKSFRAIGGKLIETSAKMDEAKSLLSKYNTADYTIDITVAAYDEVHLAIAEMVKVAWEALGFKVNIREVGVIPNDDYYKYTDSIPTDIMDDLYAEDLRSGRFSVIALDLVSESCDAFSMLAPFAHEFAGQGMDMESQQYIVPTHITGYNNEEYNKLIEKAFNADNSGERTEALHQAEKLLLDDMPIIPIIFNQNAVLIHSDLSKVEKTFFVPYTFSKAKLKNYGRFTPVDTEIAAESK